jgi:hypothetical protein
MVWLKFIGMADEVVVGVEEAVDDAELGGGGLGEPLRLAGGVAVFLPSEEAPSSCFFLSLLDSLHFFTRSDTEAML